MLVAIVTIVFIVAVGAVVVVVVVVVAIGSLTTMKKTLRFDQSDLRSPPNKVDRQISVLPQLSLDQPP